ncbi:hypothetical protein Tco_0704328 [Tanacetum coccineum]|uniref:Uncharacterized protein n=1 Tax=Tanacetum coccineum TaxID=301880 RepID=A0ABQ4Y393_9ASTR
MMSSELTLLQRFHYFAVFQKIFCSNSGIPQEGVDFTVFQMMIIPHFLIDLGYKGPLYKYTNMFVDHMHQPWKTLAAIINKCLSRKTAKAKVQRKKTVDDSQETIDVSEKSEPEPEPVKKKTSSKRRVKKKVTVSADDNIISDDPDKSSVRISKSVVIQTSKVAAIMQALKESKKRSIRQPGSQSITDAAKADAEKTSEVKDDPKKTELPPSSSSLSDSSGFGDQFLKLYSDSSLIAKLEKDVSELKTIDHSTEALAILKSQVLSVVDNYLGSKVGDIKMQMDRMVTVQLKTIRGSMMDDDDLSGINEGKAPTKGSKTGKSASAKEPIEEPITEVIMDDAGDDVAHDDNPPQDTLEPKIRKTMNPDWFKQPPRPLTLDLERNKRQVVLDQPAQPLFNQMVSAKMDPFTFNNLWATPIDFSKYVLNGLKIENLTQDILLGHAFNLLKGTCSSSIELEYNFQECLNALIDKISWNNPEEDRYLFDLSNHLPLQGPLGHRTIAADYFFNNDLEYLKTLSDGYIQHHYYEEKGGSKSSSLDSAVSQIMFRSPRSDKPNPVGGINLFQRDIKEMKDAFEQNDVYLDEIERQNDLLKDQLLEASLKHDIELIIHLVEMTKSRDSHVKTSVLMFLLNEAKNESSLCRKNKQTDNTFAKVVSNKENVIDVAVANASKAKTLLCVSSPKTRFSEKATQSKTLDTTSVASKSKIDEASASKARDKVVQIVLWVVDSGCSKHMTGDRGNRSLWK